MKNQQSKEIQMHYLILVLYIEMDMELIKTIQKQKNIMKNQPKKEIRMH